MNIEWSMNAPDGTLPEMANQMALNKVTDAYFYVSYLKAGDVFNPTYTYAADLTRTMHLKAPDTRVLAWIGVPVSITQPDGTFVANRLEDPAVRQKIADFAAMMVTDYGFDGVHLNAEMIANDDAAYIETLKTVRAALPEDAYFSVAVHALRTTGIITITPYPPMAHHWSANYLQQVAEQVDQIAVMAYDSGLPFPGDYRAWVTYQTQAAADALADYPVELLIGVSTSQEWTTSHQTQAEYLSNATAGVMRGINASANPPDGIAVYAAWEMDLVDWMNFLRQFDFSRTVLRGLSGS